MTERKDASAIASAPSAGAVRTASGRDGPQTSRGLRKGSAARHGTGGAPRPVSKPRWPLKPPDVGVLDRAERFVAALQAELAVAARCQAIMAAIVAELGVGHVRQNNQNN